MKSTFFSMRVLCVMIIMLCLMGCQIQKNKPTATKAPNSSVTYEKGPDFVGVVKSIDSQNRTITFYDVYLDGEEVCEYSGATEIYSKNDRDMAVAEIVPGEVYNVYVGTNGQKIAKMKEKADVIEKENVKVSINSEEKRLTIDDVNYAYTDRLVVLSEGKSIDPMEITSGDEVNFRGVKGQAYSLVVSKGHGYIQPRNYKDFVGGTLTIQGEAILPISDNMLLTVPEGTQSITMVNGDLTGTATVEVRRGRVTKVNMAEYQSQIPDTARVRFEIEPEGAELYINGILKDYSKALSMKYGSHSVRVVLEGYNEYSGVITVKDPSPTIRIDLAEETVEVAADEDEDDSETEVSENDDSDADNSEEAEDLEYDDDHKITVSAPSGAAVYVNGTYKGEAPCSFTKVLGSVTLTLSKEGYTTKSYSVEVQDDSQDITWSFPDLESESKG